MLISIDGIDIHYEIKGEGSTILILHGWGGCIDSFRPIIDFFSKTNKVVTIDFPGFGKSSEPNGYWGVSEYMECVKKFITELKIQPINVIAHSFGARVIILLANKYPELLNKIVITGGAGIKPKRKFDYYVKVYTFKILKKISKSKLLNKLFPNKINQLNKKIQQKYGSADYKALNDNMKKVFVNVVNEDLTKYLKNIKSSVLLIWGEDDKDTPLYMARKMEKEIKDSGLVVFNDSGHFAYLEKSQDFCKVTKFFFD